MPTNRFQQPRWHGERTDPAAWPGKTKPSIITEDLCMVDYVLTGSQRPREADNSCNQLLGDICGNKPCKIKR
jgi:hypothetical protein